MWDPDEQFFIDSNESLINEGNLIKIYEKLVTSEYLDSQQVIRLTSSIVYLIKGVKPFSFSKVGNNGVANLWSLEVNPPLQSKFSLTTVSTILGDSEVVKSQEFRNSAISGLIKNGFSPKMAKEIGNGALIKV